VIEHQTSKNNVVKKKEETKKSKLSEQLSTEQQTSEQPKKEQLTRKKKGTTSEWEISEQQASVKQTRELKLCKWTEKKGQTNKRTINKLIGRHNTTVSKIIPPASSSSLQRAVESAQGVLIKGQSSTAKSK